MAATRDVGRRALHRMTGSVSGVNWRPTLFKDEVTLNRYACSICYVLPSTTFVLPCSHGLCEKCYAGCVIDDGGSVCPLDGESFCEAECQEVQLPARKKQGLKAYCWNEPYGCEFVGSLAALLHHYEDDCTFHAFPCHQCGENIMIDVLAAHYMGRCSNISSSAALDECPLRDDASVASHDVTVARHEADEQSLCTREEDRITALQRAIDTLTSMTATIDASLDETEEKLEKLEMEG